MAVVVDKVEDGSLHLVRVSILVKVVVVVEEVGVAEVDQIDEGMGDDKFHIGLLCYGKCSRISFIKYRWLNYGYNCYNSLVN